MVVTIVDKTPDSVSVSWPDTVKSITSKSNISIPTVNHSFIESLVVSVMLVDEDILFSVEILKKGAKKK